MEMTDVERNISESQAVHVFLETKVKGSLDAIGFEIIPQNVLGYI